MVTCLHRRRCYNLVRRPLGFMGKITHSSSGHVEFEALGPWSCPVMAEEREMSQEAREGFRTKERGLAPSPLWI